MKIKISEIRLDGGTQSRADLDNTVINEYCEAMKEGAEFPPVVVFHDGEAYWLSDGFHRVYAATNARFAEIEADVRKGTVRDARRFSMSANARHGKRRTNADKRHGVLMALEDEEWNVLSDHEIAEMCYVTQPFVSKIRNELSDNGYHPAQISSNLNQDELLLLKARAEEAEKRADALIKEADVKVKARTEAMKEEYQRRFDEAVAKVKAANKPAEIDPAEIEKLAGQRTAEKIAELEKARREAEAERAASDSEYQQKKARLDELYASKEKRLQAQISGKMKEIGEAAGAGLDVKKLKGERDRLEADLARLQSEIGQEKTHLGIRAHIRKAHGAVLSSAAMMDIVDGKISKSPDCCGLSIEEMERYVDDMKSVVMYASKTIETFTGQIQKMRNGGGLRIVQNE
jgi:hypothetical protein